MTNENQMRLLYEKFLRTEGKTRKGFCLENNVSFSKYKYWERKFIGQSKPQNSFIKIESKPLLPSRPPGLVVLEYLNGVKISTQANDLSLIGQLISLL